MELQHTAGSMIWPRYCFQGLHRKNDSDGDSVSFTKELADREIGSRMKSMSFLAVILAGIVVLTSLIPPVVSQLEPRSTQGFISIDCGGRNRWDPITTLAWETDEQFLDSERELAKENVTTKATVEYRNSSEIKENAEQLRTAMVFFPGPVSRSKYCYKLLVNFSNGDSMNYLLRVMFPSNNLTAKDSSGKSLDLVTYSNRFYLTVDSTFIATIELHPDEPQTIELVISSMDGNVFVCLVPLEDRSSMAAISSLELRPFAKGMYRRSAQSNAGDGKTLLTSYLLTVSRFDFGREENSTLRFPYDKYDRLWSSPEISNPSQVEAFRNSTIATIGTYQFNETVRRNADIDFPLEAMGTAWEAKTLADSITFTVDLRKARATRPVPTFYLNLFFVDVRPPESLNNSRHVTISLGDSVWANNIVIYDGLWSQVYNKRQTFLNDTARFGIIANESSLYPAMINLAEVLGEFPAVTQRTSNADASAITNLSDSFSGVLDNAGDPCLPVPWDWIICSIELPPRITQINLTGKGERGKLDSGFGVLNRLTILDLSNNSVSGSLPKSLQNITTLRVLNLAQNNLEGEVPSFTAKSFIDLESLDLSSNKLSGNLSSLFGALSDPVVNLNLSNNSFSGSIPVEIENLTGLENVDLSSNKLSGELTFNLSQLSSLTDLNLANNGLEGTAPDHIWSSKLTNVNLTNNRFQTLNLTTWSKSVVEEKRLDPHGPKVLLLGSKITKVELLPIKDSDLSPWPPRQSVDSFLTRNPTSFILLGDSPWCKNRESSNAIAQRYLCRLNLDDAFWDPPQKGTSKRTIIIIGLTAGGFVVLMAILVLIFLSKMLRRMRDLHQIQEALAKDDVRPPFFKYDDLRAATKDFSQANVLGKGAFGAVYKAELPDGTVLAVKRLFPTEQNVTDFLKEMVLIAGIKHRHLIQLKGCSVREKQRMLVYEYAENKNLAEALWGKERQFVLNWAQRFNICLGIARGLCYLHEELQPKIIHRDIKPENILLDKELNAKIADFGLSRPVKDDSTQMATRIGGTLGYFSPEYATLGMFTEKLDVYSYGVLVLEIVAGRRCIDHSLSEDQAILRNWAFRLYEQDKLLNLLEDTLSETCSAEDVLLVSKIALSCVQDDPNKRPSMSQVVNQLMGNTDVAVDILKEFRKGISRRNTLFEDILEADGMITIDLSEEKESRYLLYGSSSTQNSNSSQVSAELSDLRPR